MDCFHNIDPSLLIDVANKADNLSLKPSTIRCMRSITAKIVGLYESDFIQEKTVKECIGLLKITCSFLNLHMSIHSFQ